MADEQEYKPTKDLKRAFSHFRGYKNTIFLHSENEAKIILEAAKNNKRFASAELDKAIENSKIIGKKITLLSQKDGKLIHAAAKDMVKDIENDWFQEWKKTTKKDYNELKKHLGHTSILRPVELFKAISDWADNTKDNNVARTIRYGRDAFKKFVKIDEMTFKKQIDPKTKINNERIKVKQKLLKLSADVLVQTQEFGKLAAAMPDLDKKEVAEMAQTLKKIDKEIKKSLTDIQGKEKAFDQSKGHQKHIGMNL